MQLDFGVNRPIEREQVYEFNYSFSSSFQFARVPLPINHKKTLLKLFRPLQIDLLPCRHLLDSLNRPLYPCT